MCAGGTRWRVCHPVPRAPPPARPSPPRRPRGRRGHRAVAGGGVVEPADARAAHADPAQVARPARRRAAAAGARCTASANELLPGDDEGARSASSTRLRGHPVVVNVWASWCGPCRQELPVFQRVSRRAGQAVAFLGVDVRDNREAAEKLLREIPVQLPERRGPGRADLPGLRARAGVPAHALLRRAGRRAGVRPPGARTSSAPTSRPTSAGTPSDADDRGRAPRAATRSSTAAFALRQAVFVDEQGVPLDEELDDRDAEALHLVALDDGRRRRQPAGCSTTATRSSSGRMAVAPRARRRGVAGRLLEEAEAQARARGARTDPPLRPDRRARRSTSAPATPPTASCFLDAGIEHVMMEKALA